MLTDSGRNRMLSPRDVIPLLLLLALTLLFAAPWIPQGLDLTDDGFNLSNQQGLLQNHGLPLHPSGALTWVSDLLGALVMACTDSLGLFGARLGWLGLVLVTAATSWLLLRRRADSLPAAVAIACAVPVSLACSTRMIVDYNRAPFLLTLIGLALTMNRGGGRPSWARALLGGLVFGLAVCARLPGLPVILLPFLPVLLGRAVEGRWDTSRLKEAVISLASSLVVVASFLGYFASALASLDDIQHTPEILVPIYLRHGLTIVGLAMLWLSGGWLVSRARSGHGRTLGLLCAVLLGSSAAVTGFSLRRTGAPAVSVMLVLTVASGGLAVLLAGGWRLMRPRSGETTGALQGATELLLVALGAALFNCMGSNGGLAKMAPGLILVAPAAVITGLELLGPFRSRDPRRFLWWTTLLALALAGVMVRTVYPYRDHPDRRVLLYSVDHPRLMGIRTGAERARSVGQLLGILEREVGWGDPVLAYGSIPMVHYLTRTRPALDCGWPDLLSLPELEHRLGDLDREGRLPRAVVRARVNTANPYWAYAESGAAEFPAQVAVLDAWRERHTFVELWSNREFIVYVPRP